MSEPYESALFETHKPRCTFKDNDTQQGHLQGENLLFRVSQSQAEAAHQPWPSCCQVQTLAASLQTPACRLYSLSIWCALLASRQAVHWLSSNLSSPQMSSRIPWLWAPCRQTCIEFVLLIILIFQVIPTTWLCFCGWPRASA